jgi:hypothetical protein
VFKDRSASRWLLLTIEVALICLAAYWLADALGQVLTTGSVTVTPETRGRPRETVHWLNGWAMLLGLFLVFASSVLAALATLRGAIFIIPAALLLPLGGLLVLLSGVLSRANVLVLLLYLTAVGAAFWINRRFGRPYAWLYATAVTGLCLLGLFIYSRA